MLLQIKWTFLSAIGLFELGSLICGTAPNSIALILGRAVAGLGAGGIFSGGVVILAYCCKFILIWSLEGYNLGRALGYLSHAFRIP